MRRCHVCLLGAPGRRGGRRKPRLSALPQAERGSGPAQADEETQQQREEGSSTLVTTVHTNPEDLQKNC